MTYDPAHDIYSSLLEEPSSVIGSDQLGVGSSHLFADDGQDLLLSSPLSELVDTSGDDGLNTPVLPSTPQLSVSSPLANRRRKAPPTKVIKEERPSLD